MEEPYRGNKASHERVISVRFEILVRGHCNCKLLAPANTHGGPSLVASVTSRRPLCHVLVAVARAVFIVETSVGKQKLVAKGLRLELCL